MPKRREDSDVTKSSDVISTAALKQDEKKHLLRLAWELNQGYCKLTKTDAIITTLLPHQSSSTVYLVFPFCQTIFDLIVLG